MKNLHEIETTLKNIELNGDLAVGELIALYTVYNTIAFIKDEIKSGEELKNWLKKDLEDTDLKTGNGAIKNAVSALKSIYNI